MPDILTALGAQAEQRELRARARATGASARNLTRGATRQVPGSDPPARSACRRRRGQRRRHRRHRATAALVRALHRSLLCAPPMSSGAFGPRCSPQSLPVFLPCAIDPAKERAGSGQRTGAPPSCVLSRALFMEGETVVQLQPLASQEPETNVRPCRSWHVRPGGAADESRHIWLEGSARACALTRR